MTHSAWIVVDLLLLLGLVLRISRVVTTDQIGEWFIQYPADKWAGTKSKRIDLVSGLVCAFCIGWWIDVAALATLWYFDGPGHAPEWWRYTAGAFALNYVHGHISARLDN